MDENVLPGGALDKTVALGSVKPLHCTLLSHKLLLSPPDEFSSSPVGLFGNPLSENLEPYWKIEFRAGVLTLANEKTPEFRSVGNKTDRNSGVFQAARVVDYWTRNINLLKRTRYLSSVTSNR